MLTLRVVDHGKVSVRGPVPQVVQALFDHAGFALPEEMLNGSGTVFLLYDGREAEQLPPLGTEWQFPGCDHQPRGDPLTYTDHPERAEREGWALCPCKEEGQ